MSGPGLLLFGDELAPIAAEALALASCRECRALVWVWLGSIETGRWSFYLDRAGDRLDMHPCCYDRGAGHEG